MHRVLNPPLVLLALLALLAAACGQEPALEEPADAPDDAAGEEPADDEPAEDAGVSLAVTDSDVGEILADAEGMVVYLFEPDEGSGESTCYDDCAETWPALTVDGDPVAGAGVDEGLLDTTERDDGGTQVVYNGHPMYYFANDQAPGDTNGQGINEVWWVVGPDGEPVQDAADDS